MEFKPNNGNGGSALLDGFRMDMYSAFLYRFLSITFCFRSGNDPWLSLLYVLFKALFLRKYPHVLALLSVYTLPHSIWARLELMSASSLWKIAVSFNPAKGWNADLLRISRRKPYSNIVGVHHQGTYVRRKGTLVE